MTVTGFPLTPRYVFWPTVQSPPKPPQPTEAGGKIEVDGEALELADVVLQHELHAVFGIGRQRQPALDQRLPQAPAQLVGVAQPGPQLVVPGNASLELVHAEIEVELLAAVGVGPARRESVARAWSRYQSCLRRTSAMTSRRSLAMGARRAMTWITSFSTSAGASVGLRPVYTPRAFARAMPLYPGSNFYNYTN